MDTNRNLEDLSKEGKGQLLDERCYFLQNKTKDFSL